MKIKIFFLIESSETGGAEVILLNLLKSLDKEVFEPYVGLFYEGWLSEQLRNIDILPHIFGSARSFDIQQLIKLYTFIKNNDISLIHAHLFGAGIYAGLVGKLCKVPVICTLHGAVDVTAKERFRGIKFSIFNHCISQTIFVSESLRRNFLEQGLGKETRSAVIYNGIDIDKFKKPVIQKIWDQMDYSKDDIIVGAIGDLRPVKGYDVLIRAVALSRKRLPYVKFLVAGTKTELYSELENLINTLGVKDYIKFIGHRDDIPNILSHFSIYILPSISEGFSLTTIEAMASGIPVVVTRSGGPEEIVTHSKDGLLVDINNPEAIVDAIESLIYDKDLCNFLSKNASFTVYDKFSLNSMMKQYMSLYQEVCNS